MILTDVVCVAISRKESGEFQKVVQDGQSSGAKVSHGLRMRHYLIGYNRMMGSLGPISELMQSGQSRLMLRSSVREAGNEFKVEETLLSMFHASCNDDAC
ncbi:uncharacterized protein PHALS_07151 [Plasmopara halstedii]|uniref:Uncharacterized protein n=1 Tax=Plasmopara halstedii TaxID=4781 RepID=A0A0P1B3S0_PLAHL|nr:uncharacterized protein PHALS_07151 [Plasmopara halstedii]CEG49386.1 hypothetical protein PHALS_07151 [Plasmopara halstedii]|eukprot:XP_024585755.1 hypothetical protein PHALS_07151 [Plasmopara halstedii]